MVMEDMSEEAERIVEAVLFASATPLSIDEIKEATGLRKREVQKALKAIIARYSSGEFAFEVTMGGHKYVMQLKPEYAHYARKVAPLELSEGVLKTAALIGYYQPMKQSELVDMIGQKAYAHVRVLHENGLIKTRKSGSTKMIYITERFCEYFGLGTTDPEEVRALLEKKVGKARKRG